MIVNFKFLSLLIVISIGAFSFISCFSPPEEEIMAVEAAVKAASAAGADEFSPRLFDEAQSFLQGAKNAQRTG